MKPTAGADGLAEQGARGGRPSIGRSRFAGRRRGGAQSQVQGRWSLTAPVFRRAGAGGADRAPGADPRAMSAERRRTLAELLLERYGIVTREQVLAEGVPGGFAMLYDTFANLETLGVCRRGYFVEGMGGAQFALPGAVERLRATPGPPALAAAGRGAPGAAGEPPRARTLVLAAADPAQPYGACLPWPKRDGQDRRPARVAGAYVVLVADEPVLYVERGGRGLLTLGGASGGRDAIRDGGRDAVRDGGREAGDRAGREPDPLREALAALADAVRAGRVGKLSLERIDGEPAIASSLAGALVELGFHPGPRRLTLTA